MKRLISATLLILILGISTFGAVTTVIYGSTVTITCTLASLANGSARSCAMANNTSNNDIEAHLYIKYKTGTGTAAAGTITPYGYACVNADTSRCTDAGEIVGTDATVTIPTTGTIMPILAGPNTCFANVDAKVYVCGPFSIAQTWGGSLPAGWGVAILNNSGAALDSTAANFGVFYDRLRLNNQ